MEVNHSDGRWMTDFNRPLPPCGSQINGWLIRWMNSASKMDHQNYQECRNQKQHLNKTLHTITEHLQFHDDWTNSAAAEDRVVQLKSSWTPLNSMLGQVAVRIFYGAFKIRWRAMERPETLHRSKLKIFQESAMWHSESTLLFPDIARLWLHWGHKMSVWAYALKWHIYSSIARGRSYVMAGVLLRTQGSAVSRKLFGWVVLENAARSNARGQNSKMFSLRSHKVTKGRSSQLRSCNSECLASTNHFTSNSNYC